MSVPVKHPSSYRDPSGFLFYHDNVLYRQVDLSFREDFDHFMQGGLYDSLVGKGLLIPHEPVQANLTGNSSTYQVIRPEPIPFISYPYEWSFDMLKDAALLTLEVAREALSHGMMLKDASAYNVQWYQGKMIFIDTLSFERYREGMPWIAYRQFCEHFLAPLALMHYKQYPLHQFLLAWPEGVPVTLAQSLLPFKSRFHLHVYLHLHLHAKISTQKKQGNSASSFSKSKLQNLLRSLEEAVKGFRLNAPSGVWSGYYNEAVQREDYVEQKRSLLSSWLKELDVETALDAGANEGSFSQVLAEQGIRTISADFDHYSVNRLYQRTKEKGWKNILPLLLDLSNPTPAIGVNNEERQSFLNRCQPQLVMALALIHHLVIGKNISFAQVAQMFATLSSLYLVIEFVPKEDEKIQLMLGQKKDIYHHYTEPAFLEAFGLYFTVVKKQQVGSSGRTLYLMQKNG